MTYVFGPVAEWYRQVEEAASVIVKHTYSGSMVLNGAVRPDLLAVRREDWYRLYELIEGPPRDEP